MRVRFADRRFRSIYRSGFLTLKPGTLKAHTYTRSLHKYINPCYLCFVSCQIYFGPPFQAGIFLSCLPAPTARVASSMTAVIPSQVQFARNWIMDFVWTWNRTCGLLLLKGFPLSRPALRLAPRCI